MIILDHEQGTDEWLKSRLGKPSASMFSQLITNNGKISSSASKYIRTLIAEKLTGEHKDFYKSQWMQRGNELEPEAREMYSFITGNEVVETGFILHDSEDFGCSPDGLICGTNTGGVEIKCPAPDTHVEYMQDKQAGVKKYWQQIQGCMYVTDRQWWDFFSYHPSMRHVLVRVERDEQYIAKLAVEINKAVKIIKTEVERMK